jgi:UDP-N-acetylmuramyl pentapeptide phosphotransferase/UDP-N-acetylglucosamine-1-phosphate transferase
VNARQEAVAGRVPALFAAAGAARAAYAGLVRRPPGEPALWERKNARGRVVDLYGGLAAAAATAVTVGCAPGLPRRTRAAAALAVLAAGGCGAYDDIAGARDGRRGFRAHLSALRQGEVTTGAVKLLGICAAGLAAGALLRDRPVDRALAGVVIAGSAHLVNLLDVSPGRAAKAVLAAGAPGLLGRRAAGVLAAAPSGAAAAVLGDDLAERTMLGDCGAHALGAALGVSIAVVRGRAGLALHAAALAALAAAGDRAGGETVWGSPVLRWADRLGRLPEGGAGGRGCPEGPAASAHS